MTGNVGWRGGNGRFAGEADEPENRIGLDSGLDFLLVVFDLFGGPELEGGFPVFDFRFPILICRVRGFVGFKSKLFFPEFEGAFCQGEALFVHVLTVVVHFFLLRVCFDFMGLFFYGALVLSEFELSLPEWPDGPRP